VAFANERDYHLASLIDPYSDPRPVAMATDHIRYDVLAQEALRGVVRRVLTDAAKSGLPGEHHFYVSFDTRAPDVRISPRLHEKYPEEMTIVLQHQFWDLIVTEQGFEVGLSFNGVPERLSVPFDAIKGFFDPSVQFALQFEVGAKQSAETAAGPAAAPPGPTEEPETAAKRGARPKRPQVPAPATAPPAAAAPSGPTAKPADDGGDKPDRPSGGGEVVRLDRFRKK
jgi:uncharacterized protein